MVSSAFIVRNKKEKQLLGAELCGFLRDKEKLGEHLFENGIYAGNDVLHKDNFNQAIQVLLAFSEPKLRYDAILTLTKCAPEKFAEIMQRSSEISHTLRSEHNGEDALETLQGIAGYKVETAWHAAAASARGGAVVAR